MSWLKQTIESKASQWTIALRLVVIFFLLVAFAWMLA